MIFAFHLLMLVMQKKEKLAEKYENHIRNKDLIQRQKEVDKDQFHRMLIQLSAVLTLRKFCSRPTHLSLVYITKED